MLAYRSRAVAGKEEGLLVVVVVPHRGGGVGEGGFWETDYRSHGS